MFAGEGHNCIIRTMPVCEALVNSVVVFDASRNAGGDHHCTRFAADLLLSDYLLMEMLHHHSCLFSDNVRITLDKGTQLLLRTLLVKHRIILDCFHDLVPAVDGRIVPKHIKNEALLNGLLHRIDMERAMLDFTILLIGNTKHLLGLILRSSCESKVAGGGDELTSLHHGIDLILVVCIVICGKTRKCQIHIRGITSTLAGMRLVDDDGKLVILMFLPDLRYDVWELFYCRYNDALAILYGLAQITGMFCPCYGVFDLHELLDRIADLFIQNTAVSNHKDGINHRVSVFFKSNQLMRQPCDRV